jgi:putative transposase
MTTKSNIALAELVEKGADADLLREMIQYVAQRMMDMDVESLCAAAYGGRNPERLNSRNGYRERLWETRAGSVDLKIPINTLLLHRHNPQPQYAAPQSGMRLAAVLA